MVDERNLPSGFTPDTIFVSERSYRALVRMSAYADASSAPGFRDFDWRKQKRLMRKAGDRAVLDRGLAVSKRGRGKS